MPITLEQTDREYYETFPDGPHRTGDIWTEIPNNGLLPVSRTSALLISPDCDLLNRKTDTLVFVPIVPLGAAMKLGVFRRYFSGEMQNIVRTAFPDLEPVCNFGDKEFRNTLRKRLATRHGNPKEKELIERLGSWLNFCENSEPAEDMQLPFLTARSRQKLIQNVITNAFGTDVHFLPRERRNSSYPVIPKHALCLFRYVLTFPVSLFTVAGCCTTSSWSARVSTIRYFGRPFADALPVRGLRLRQAMLADLLTRYISLYSRIGSEDFSPSCLNQLREEV